ncbi:endonuclease domain-containing protein [Xanthobacter sp. 126]|uniref:endonuclease domain-containing protein n=1 Tax=Xanthobacter sp. 126 TaxID=1131814 RepID=UPI00045E61DC|nr:endonuclease domain-containing protein [Xanthobacter sp. 126]
MPAPGTEAPAPAKRSRARALRETMTDAERKLWQVLRDRRLEGAKFRRQMPVGPYVADFLTFQHRLVVEADGGQHAESARDAVRDAYLAANGFRVLRFWNNDILLRTESVLEAIYQGLRATPLPQGERGGRTGRPLSPRGRGWIAAQPRDG